MHTSKDDYLINSLRLVSAKVSTQIYGAILPECLNSLAVKESSVPSKIARKFKKPSPSKKDSDLVPVDKEPVTKSKRVKRSVKQSSTKPAAGVIIREAPVETKSKSKEKEKVDVTCGKGIELLSEVALTEEAQMKEIRKKSLRDFYKTHPSGSSTVAEKPQVLIRLHLLSQVKELENESNEQESNSKQEEESKDDDQKEEEFVHTPTDDKDDDNLESESDDVIKSDEEKGMDDTTYQFDNYVDARLKEPTQTDKEVAQGEDIPHADAEIVSPLDVHVHHEVSRTQAPTLFTIPVSVITKSSPVFTNIPQSSKTFTPPPILTTPNPPPTMETTNPLSTLPDFALKRKISKDAELTTGPKNKDSTSSSSKDTKSQPKTSRKSVQLEEPVFEVADSDMPQDQELNPGDNDDEPRKDDTSRRDWFKKPTPLQEPTNLDWHEGKTTQKGTTQNWLMTLVDSTSTDKSLKDFDELMSTHIDFSRYILNGLKIKNLTQEILLGLAFKLLKGTRSNYVELEYDFEECYKALSEKLDWEILKAYLQGGVLTMTYTTSTTKTKAAQHDLPRIKDMVPNIWSPVKVAYDKYALWGISYWREQRKSFYTFARGMQSRGDVYSTRRILAITDVKVMRKHGYGYLEEIVLRRADNVLYRFKEGDFPQLQINDIEDMLILVVQN
ncbi:hypothetical protein Tco_0294935 [Tanacetum coccineum]